MSGTSLDGIDAAILRTDGERVDGIGPTATVPYYNAFRARLRALLGRADGTDAHLKGVVRDLTVKHAMAVRYLLASHRVTAAEVDVIGFHGHTILHRPDERLTCQIGDGPLLARLTGIPVVNDFRSRDVAEGGQGAPLAPLYHAALARDLDRPLAVLNLGGVANVTWLGTGSEAEGDIIAFDVGPGNAMIDDWMLKTTGRALDDRGAMAATGRVDWAALERLLEHPFFAQRPPKTLDRNTFACDAVDGLAPADGAATLTAFTVAAAARAARLLPAFPRRWLVSGGGRHNLAIMAGLAAELGQPVEPVETVGWNGDALEAQAFAFLAVRSVYALPLSLPGTTGVARPTTGGTLSAAPDRPSAF